MRGRVGMVKLGYGQTHRLSLGAIFYLASIGHLLAYLILARVYVSTMLVYGL